MSLIRTRMHSDPMGAGSDATLRRVDDARYPETPGVPKQCDLVQVDAEASQQGIWATASVTAPGARGYARAKPPIRGGGSVWCCRFRCEW